MSAAHAADTVGVVIDQATGLVKMVVVPDNDAELNDPAFNPPGAVQVRLPKAHFQGATQEQFVARASAAAKMQLKAQMAPRAAPVIPPPNISAAERAEYERKVAPKAVAK